MSVIIPYNYVNGNILKPDQHNRNIYTDTLHEGLMSTANGQLHSTNFSSDFEVQSEHVHPEEVIRGRQERGLETLDYFSDGIGDSDQATFVNVAGCGVKVYIPYDITLAVWQWSFFFSDFRSLIFESTSDDAGDYKTSDIVVRASLNGTGLLHTMRSLPQTSKSGVLNDYNNTNEKMAAMSWDMSHMQEDVSAGWHDLNLTIYMEQVLATVDGAPLEQTLSVPRGGFSGSSVTYYLYNRASFGIRNARVLTIL